MAPANENSGTKRTAGFNENWKVKNIYDLAGNVWEWTSEACSSYFINRGGSCNGSGSVRIILCRDNNKVSDIYDGLGFRIRLYIK